MPWEARLWLSLLDARELNFFVRKHQVRIDQSNGLRQGSPDGPVFFAAEIGETLDATLDAVNGGETPACRPSPCARAPASLGRGFHGRHICMGRIPCVRADPLPLSSYSSGGCQLMLMETECIYRVAPAPPCWGGQKMEQPMFRNALSIYGFAYCVCVCVSLGLRQRENERE